MVNIDEKGLPEYCFVALETTGEVVMVHRYQMGYSPTRKGNEPWYGEETADAVNADRGITKAQAIAMKNGSMFGWDIPAANPNLYDENGMFKKEKLKEVTGEFTGKKFSDRYNLDEIISKAESDGWEVDTEDFDKGGDWIWLRDMHNRMLQVKFNTFNYQFFVWNPLSDEPCATHLSVDLEGQEWYDYLLNLFFKDEMK
ncbi:hypothetical protein [Paenibacillus sp. Mc5Re-14]|uniref:hypothetical protein n=1 Tax=Paenibacillus sp. Mc5Re-14 TaxID=1030529 RepID=UPI000B09B403|nr:hypothetical protein [Paenibacillus sp. Mc5Re-14]